MVDVRRIVTGVLIGIPLACSTYWGAQKVTEFAISDLNSRLTSQREALLIEIRHQQDQQRRDIDQVREDIRELRSIATRPMATNREH